LEEIGQVLEAEGQFAKIRMNRTGMCAQCGRCGIMAFQPASDIIVDADNPVGARAGDSVRLEMESRYYLTAAFIVYVFPLLLGGLGYLLGALIASQMGVSEGTLGIAGAVFLFALSFAGIRAYDKKAAREGRYRPHIVEVLGKEWSGWR